jgi:hypothetical protein
LAGGGDRGRRNPNANRHRSDDTAAGTNFGRPRRYTTVEEQASYEMGFYEELGALGEEFLDGAAEEG